LGYGKLLGGGRLTRPIVVKVRAVSAKAIRVVKEAGGEVLITQ